MSCAGASRWATTRPEIPAPTIAILMRTSVRPFVHGALMDHRPGTAASAPVHSSTMSKAVQFSQYGEPDVLHVADVPAPEPGPGQVRIAVRAAGINPADWKIRRGM